ncbi:MULTISPECIES: hypothetical protein [Pseudomonas]|uniref:Uncharacterized protein n=1 Tax=Pseudomonas donghuensis TaxID=1163398 RepID=A0AAP0SG43_9PSED|nr:MULTISPECIES: hypothetical protein [Pseudomonas]MDF9896116.1 uncharacterized protein YhhL (DUF1145 family) [Pseudomonas vranovensis]KDN99784.1 hypothetical protein BV82_2197 [Pseudomonas donghuensis]MBS7598534.1 hypothetical protein [Pseudomonas sp. RC2C2]MCP6690224.1 hypothetical protein [Pseudomonas donghuensis]MCP6697124.1 hypothetical protein [Pseudomonas donghuensis]
MPVTRPYRLAIALTVHVLAIVTYLLLHNTGMTMYRQMAGGLMSRGVAIGMGMYLIFYFVVLMNLVIALVPRLKWRLLLAAAIPAAILLYLLPQHPLRALFCSVLGFFTALAAIGANQLVLHLLSKVRRQ